MKLEGGLPEAKHPLASGKVRRGAFLCKFMQEMNIYTRFYLADRVSG